MLGTGFIEVITGPMASGKSEELIRKLNRFKLANKKFIIFKPTTDYRDGKAVKSRNGSSFEDSVYSVASSKEALSIYLNSEQIKGQKEIQWNKNYSPDGMSNNNISVVAFDEAHFFDDEIVDLIEKLALWGVHVIVSGLDKDSFGKPFGPMPYILAISDEVIKLKAVCSYTKEDGATFTYRKGGGNDQICVGGDELYEPRSRAAWCIGMINSIWGENKKDTEEENNEV